MTPAQSSFAVFCIETLSADLKIPGNEVYRMLAVESDILDGYIACHFDTLHTQSRSWILDDLKGILADRGMLSDKGIWADASMANGQTET